MIEKLKLVLSTICEAIKPVVESGTRWHMLPKSKVSYPVIEE
jgi:hypothetical protein